MKYSLVHRFPQVKDFWGDYTTAQNMNRSMRNYNKKCQVVKDNKIIFQQYTDLPSYVFQALLIYPNNKVVDMQYVTTYDYPHNATNFKQEPGAKRKLTFRNIWQVFLNQNSVRLHRTLLSNSSKTTES